MKTALNFAVTAILAAVLTACGPLVKFPGDDKEAPSLYALTPVRDITPAARYPQATLMVKEPSTAAVFDARRIALMPETRELRYYAGAQWVDRTPHMVQNLLITAFEETGAFGDVGAETMALAAGYRLETGIRSFNADYRANNAPVIRIEMTARLFEARPLSLLASRTVLVEEPAQADSMAEIIAAFDRASHRVTTTLVEWTIESVGTGRNAQPATP